MITGRVNSKLEPVVSLNVKLYEGSIEWQDASKDVLVLGMGDEALLGMNLLRTSKLTIDRDTITIE